MAPRGTLSPVGLLPILNTVAAAACPDGNCGTDASGTARAAANGAAPPASFGTDTGAVVVAGVCEVGGKPDALGAGGGITAAGRGGLAGDAGLATGGLAGCGAAAGLRCPWINDDANPAPAPITAPQGPKVAPVAAPCATLGAACCSAGATAFPTEPSV